MDIIEKIANTLHTIFYELTGGDIDRDDWTEDGCLPSHYCFRKAKEILAVIKETGYVKLADDQSLPDKQFIKFKAIPELTMPVQKELADTAIMVYEQSQQDMLKAGWRKMEVKDGNETTD